MAMRELTGSVFAFLPFCTLPLYGHSVVPSSSVQLGSIRWQVYFRGARELRCGKTLLAKAGHEERQGSFQAMVRLVRVLLRPA